MSVQSTIKRKTAPDIRARNSRWVVSVWTPRNSTRPRIITSSPMMRSFQRAGFATFG
jgi:hypothetical protein